MSSLLLSTDGGWVPVFIIVIGLFVAAYVLVAVYSAITEKSGTKDKSGCGWPIFLIIVAIIIGILINLKNCSCSSGSGGEGGGYWDNTPRHTQLQKPSQNNVNSCTFHTFAI